jgi:hypothetical protein
MPRSLRLCLNFVVTQVDTLGVQLQTIKRGVSGKRFAFIALQNPILPKWIPFATDQSMDRVAPQIVMIIEVFIAQHQTIDPLTKLRSS